MPRLQQGHKYAASAVIPQALKWAASEGVIRGALEGEGFGDVVVSTSMPPAWPGPGGQDYYAYATWPKVDRDFETPPAVTWFADLSDASKPPLTKPPEGPPAPPAPPKPEPETPPAPPSPGPHGEVSPAEGLFFGVAAAWLLYVLLEGRRRRR